MASPSALQFDTYYHIYNRGTNGENIFLEKQNYSYFLRLYEKHIVPIADTFAFCLMKNHFHLAVRTRSEGEITTKTDSLKPGFISSKFSNFFNAYAKSMNKKYNRTGSLFEHPFGRVQIQSDRQFWAVIAYIHQNPQKHGFVEDFRAWPYSSYGLIMNEKTTFLNRDAIINLFGSSKNYVVYHNELVQEVAERTNDLRDF
jgi:putative transposase